MVGNKAGQLAGNASSQSAPHPYSYLQPALTELLKAYDYAHFAHRDVWHLAVESGTLRRLGLTNSDFRWLVCMGFVKHAREITRLEDDGREFRRTGILSFCKRTCFVLTDHGAAFARDLASGRINVTDALMKAASLEALRIVPFREREIAAAAVPGKAAAQGEPATPLSDGRLDAVPPAAEIGLSVRPHWDAERRELRLNGVLVKQFKWTAANQEMILAAFEEEGWATRVDDPLPPLPEQDSKRRLSDTIKCLNRKQQNPLIHFRGDGTGEGVIWELVQAHPERNGEA